MRPSAIEEMGMPTRSGPAGGCAPWVAGCDHGDMATRLPSLLERAILFAHHGTRSDARHHTIKAFEVAIRLDATGLMADAWLTSDDGVVVNRTGILRRFPRRVVRDVATRDLIDSHPTIEDLLDTAGDAPVRLAVAEPEAGVRILAIARRRDALSRLWMGHDDLEVLARWRDAGPEVGLVNVTALDRLPFGAERRGAELAAARIDAIALPESEWSGGLVTLFHRFEVLAFADDAHYEHQLARVIDMGVDAVTSDHAARMAAVAATFD